MLPHITNSQAGVNKYDPAHKNLFEVYFTLPEALRSQFASDEAILTEHVVKIDGLANLNKVPQVSQQKFMGTDRSYIQPGLDQTHVEFTVEFTLNLRNGIDNYIYKLLKAWGKLGYDISTGEKVLKKDYCADWMRIVVANRIGDIYQEIVLKDVMMSKGPEDATSSFEYDAREAFNVSVSFVSDWWDEINA
jgi:hypothetical protein